MSRPHALTAVLLAALITAAVVPISTGAQPAPQAPPEMPARGGITRIEIERVESPAFDGHAFGAVGPYEKLVGRAYGEADPSAPENAAIVNLDRAPRNARGMVEYDVDLYVVKPVEAARGNRTLLYQVVNRGNKGLPFNLGARATNDPRSAADLGDGFAMREGYTLVWSGWQGDVSTNNDRMGARYPIATNPDGGPFRQWVRAQYVFTGPTHSVPLSYDRGQRLDRSYPAARESAAQATLYRRASPSAEPEIVPRAQWQFAACPDGGVGSPSDTDICLPAGFSPDLIYDLVYEAHSPQVHGLMLAATRDLIGFLRYNTTAANPLIARGGSVGQVAVDHTIGFGASQSGRYLRGFLHRGFNADLAGRRVFDGLMPHITGSRVMHLDDAFLTPGRFPGAVEGSLYPGNEFPFTYEVLTDPLTGRTDGLLARCREQGVCPRIMHTDSGNEFWTGRASLVSTDPTGERDAPIPDGVRLYFFAGTQHIPGANLAGSICRYPTNPMSYQEAQRALLTALRRWVASGTEPPPSAYPRLSDGTLVRPWERQPIEFPSVPGVSFLGQPNGLQLVDYSAPLPRALDAGYPILVPTVDTDGNERGGIRGMDLQAPIATYTGWNRRAPGFVEDELCYLDGSYFPFPTTAAQRVATSDPRVSLEERYVNREQYMGVVSRAAERLVNFGWLLPEDAERFIEQARTRELGPAIPTASP